MPEIDLEHLTVRDLLALGVTAVDAACDHCSKMIWLAPIDFLPPTTTIKIVENLMVCRRARGLLSVDSRNGFYGTKAAGAAGLSRRHIK